MKAKELDLLIQSAIIEELIYNKSKIQQILHLEKEMEIYIEISSCKVAILNNVKEQEGKSLLSILDAKLLDNKLLFFISENKEVSHSILARNYFKVKNVKELEFFKSSLEREATLYQKMQEIEREALKNISHTRLDIKSINSKRFEEMETLFKNSETIDELLDELNIANTTNNEELKASVLEKLKVLSSK